MNEHDKRKSVIETIVSICTNDSYTVKSKHETIESVIISTRFAQFPAVIAGFNAILSTKRHETIANEAKQLLKRLGDDYPHFECPKCHKKSYNQNDIEKGYCGNCNEFTK
ncbi:hypothetical protein NTE19_003348 [Vibrio fluvialis]|nr:hypothetical protein [Vibrio fluvialis]